MSVLTLPQSMVRDRENGIKANATHVDENFTALETAVNGKLDLDGTSVPTADISMGGNKLTNVGSPALSGDAATKGYVDSADMLKADLASPTFTGEPKAPTPTSGDNSTKIATTAFVAPTIIQANTNKNDISEIIGNIKSITASDSVNSIVTTTDISKSSNGYVKLGNGIIIQWGEVTTSGSGGLLKRKVDLPVPFSSTHYSFSATAFGTGGADIYAFKVDSSTITTSSFEVVAAGGSTYTGFRWIAIGY